MNRVLYAIALRWLSFLPADEAGRRVFDETLADWRREAAKASGAAAGLFVVIRAVLSVLRSVAAVAAHETIAIRRSGVLTRVFLWIAAYLVFVNTMAQLSTSNWQPSTLSRLYGQIPLIAFALPVALLLGTGLGDKRRIVPALGLSLVALFSSVVLLGWGAPLASRAFFDANPGTVTRGGKTEISPNVPGEGLQIALNEWWGTQTYAPTRLFMNDLTVAQLSVKIVEGPKSGGWSAIRWMSFFFAYVVTCAVVPVFASELKRRHVAVRLVMAGSAILLVFVQGTLSNLNRPFAEFSITWWLGAYWIPVAWIVMCLIALSAVSGNDPARPRLQITNNQ